MNVNPLTRFAFPFLRVVLTRALPLGLGPEGDGSRRGRARPLICR
mgnify:CR=1 FL=1